MRRGFVSAGCGQVSWCFMGAPPQILLGNLGMADSLILMVLALVVFGPRRLPQIGRQIGKLMYEFRKASNDFKFQMEEELRVAEEADRRKKEEEERARKLALSPPAQTQSLEAQAGIGAAEAPAAAASPYSGDGANAVEQASVSAQPSFSGQSPAEGSAYSEPASPYSGEESDPAAAAETQQRIYPRINPPSTGETVPAARYGASSQPEPAEPQETAADASIAAEANIGAEPAAAEPSSLAAAEGTSESNSTETVSQHG